MSSTEQAVEPDIYAEVVQDYCAFYGHGEDAFHSLVVFGAATLLRRGGTMLDVGCGPGIALDWMDVDPAHYLGLDSSLPMIEEARRLHPGYEFVHSAFEDWESPRFFDLVLGAWGPLLHVPELKLPYFAAALERALAKGGQYLLMGAGEPDLRVRILDGEPHHIHYHSPATLFAAFGGAVYPLSTYLAVTNLR